MSTPPGQPPFDAPPGAEGRQPTEDEMRAAYEAELKRIRVEDVLVQTVVSLLNLGGRKAGLVPGTEDERDPEQVRLAIEGANALLPFVEPALGQEAGQVRDAISQLQMAFTRIQGESGTGTPVPGPGGGVPPGPAEQTPGQSGQPPSSGRLWVPGQ
jgi:hypothetical protein